MITIYNLQRLKIKFDVDAIQMSLWPETVFEPVERSPDKTALIAGDMSLTYAQLRQQVRRLAGFLAARFSSGSRFGILLPNSIAAALGLLAAPPAGLIAVPIDTDTSIPNFKRLITSCGIDVLLTSKKMLARFKPDVKTQILADDDSASLAGSSLSKIFRDAGYERNIFPTASADAVAFLLHTTGTSGAPKGVMLTRRNLGAAVRHIIGFMGFGNDIVESIPMRLSHSFGFARFRSVLEVGGTAILEEGFLRPERVLHRIKKFGANALSSVPAGFAVLLEHFAEQFREVGPQLRFIEIGSAPMIRRHKEMLLDLCPNARICMHYGLTESSRAFFLDLRAEKDRWGTVGRPAPGIEIRIEDEGGNKLERDTSGEIFLRGETTAAGYWGRPDLDKLAFGDGWFRTGDLGYLDAAGYLHLTGRAAEMINLGGLKVAPREVEEALLTLDGIREAAVLGIPSEIAVTGNIIKAFLVVRRPDRPPNIEDLTKALLRVIEPYKVPEEFEIVPALPKTDSGKVRKDLLLAAARGRHG